MHIAENSILVIPLTTAVAAGTPALAAKSDAADATMPSTHLKIAFLRKPL